MSDESTASSLVFAGAIIQLVFAIIFFVIAGFVAILLVPFLANPLFAPFGGSIILIVVGVLGILGIIDLFFAISWFNWRHEPSAHKTGLIVTGIIGLIFTGFIAGLLVLIGGAIAPEPGKFAAEVPLRTTKPTKAARFCPVCGNQIGSDDQYCWKCGASL